MIKGQWEETYFIVLFEGFVTFCIDVDVCYYAGTVPGPCLQPTFLDIDPH